jgi:tripartite-type tricarboxylate transporter receptor subunit TctC
MGALPNIPPIGDFVPGYEGSGWLGVGAPAKTPADIIEKLNRGINAVIADAKMKDHMVGLGIESQAMTPAQFGKLCADATEKWAKVIKFAGIKTQ